MGTEGREINQNLEAESPTLSPIVLRDKGGRVRWKLRGNTDEQNLQLGIRNIQGLFLEKFPEFNLIPTDDRGTILAGQRLTANIFILERIGTMKKAEAVFGGSFNNKHNAPYFHGSFTEALHMAFLPWGINVETRRGRSYKYLIQKLEEEKKTEEELVTERYFTNQFHIDRRTLRPFLQGLTTVKGRVSITGRETFLFKKSEVVERIKDLIDIPKVDKDTREYVNKDGERWVSANFFKLKYGIHDVTVLNHLSNIRAIRGRDNSNRIGILYNKSEAEQALGESGLITLDEKPISPEQADEQLRRLLAESMNEELVQTQIKPQVSPQGIIPEDFGNYLDSFEIPEGYWTPEKIEATALYVYQTKGTLNRLYLRKDGLEDAIRRNYPGGYPALFDKLEIPASPIVDAETNIYTDKEGRQWTHASILGQMFGLTALAISRILNRSHIPNMRGGSKNLQTVTLYDLEEAKRILRDSGYEEQTIENISPEQADEMLKKLLEG